MLVDAHVHMFKKKVPSKVIVSLITQRFKTLFQTVPNSQAFASEEVATVPCQTFIRASLFRQRVSTNLWPKTRCNCRNMTKYSGLERHIIRRHELETEVVAQWGDRKVKVPLLFSTGRPSF